MLQYWFGDLVPSPSRAPLTLETCIRELLPATLCYYATAVLVLIPGTFPIRLGLLPITLSSVFRAATRLDILSLRYNDERLVYLNKGLLLSMTTLGFRVVVWTFQSKPFKRISLSSKVESSCGDEDQGFKQIIVDAGDLVCNLRGCGWNWSCGLQIPPETRSISSKTSFVLETLLSLLSYVVAFDFLHYFIQSFDPSTIGSALGGTIYDYALSPIPRYLRSTTISFFSGLGVWCAIQIGYHFNTLFGLLLFRQQPSQWPPIFNSPHLSVSLTEFWAKRWHQLFRDVFISFGGKPLSLIIGRVGGVLGAFLVSGILHDFGLWGMGRGTEFSSVGGYFLIMGVGILLEQSWKRLTGKRVGGTYGRIWTYLWVVGWGNMIIDAWSRKGVLGSAFFPSNRRPTDLLLKPLLSVDSM